MAQLKDAQSPTTKRPLSARRRTVKFDISPQSGVKEPLSARGHRDVTKKEKLEKERESRDKKGKEKEKEKTKSDESTSSTSSVGTSIPLKKHGSRDLSGSTSEEMKKSSSPLRDFPRPLKLIQDDQPIMRSRSMTATGLVLRSETTAATTTTSTGTKSPSRKKPPIEGLTKAVSAAVGSTSGRRASLSLKKEAAFNHKERVC